MPLSDRARSLIEAHPLRDYFYQMLQKESGGNSRSVSSTGAAGPWQFTRGTGKTYGLLDRSGDRRMDDVASTAAMIKLTEDNQRILRNKLGREPTKSELALGHQQGAETGANMLRGTGNATPYALKVNAVNPNAPPQAAAEKIMNYYGFDGRKQVPGMSLATNPYLPSVAGDPATAASPFPNPPAPAPAPPADPGLLVKAGIMSPETEAEMKSKLLGADGKGGTSSPLGGIDDISKGLHPQVNPQQAASAAQISPLMAGGDVHGAANAGAAQQLMAALMANRQKKYGLSLTGGYP